MWGSWPCLPPSAHLLAAQQNGLVRGCPLAPAFAVSKLDSLENIETYQIFRHPAAARTSCADALPAGRAAIGCILNRLIPAHRRKRTESGGIIRPRRAQTRQLRRITHIGRISGLGKQCGKPWAARHALIGAPAKMLVFMQLFSRPIIIVKQCGRIDLVTAAPRRLN